MLEYFISLNDLNTFYIWLFITAPGMAEDNPEIIDDDETDMMKLMGFSSFDTTKVSHTVCGQIGRKVGSDSSILIS